MVCCSPCASEHVVKKNKLGVRGQWGISVDLGLVSQVSHWENVFCFFFWCFFARYRKESCEWLIFEHLLSFQSSWLLLKVPQVTPPWHVPMPEWNIVGGSRLHHLADCLLAATSHWRILATSLEEGLTQAKLQFQLVISEERVCVCLCPCVCLLACWDNGWVL